MSNVTSKTKTSTSKSSIKTKSKASTPVEINEYLKDEISRLSETQGVPAKLLEDFAYFVIENYKKKPPKAKPLPKVKPLTAPQLKQAIYQHFNVKNTNELRKSGAFKMATDGMDSLNLNGKEGWELLYRKFVGILPNEENEQGYGCINGINIFKYFKPWQVFGLNPATATPEDVKQSYYDLSKIYHPDRENGDAQIFDRINLMYKSISAEA